MALVVLENLHSASLVMVSPLDAVGKMMRTLGPDQLEMLLKHHAAQQTRNLYYQWEEIQIVLGLALGVCLYFATQKRMLSLVLCAIMISIVMFQFFAVTPELSYRGRETDFAGPNAPTNAMVRTLILYQMLVISEGLKLVVGGILASYLFAFKTSRKRSGRRQVESTSSIESGGLVKES